MKAVIVLVLAGLSMTFVFRSAHAAEKSDHPISGVQLSRQEPVRRADRAPRKVVIASALAHFSGSVSERLALAVKLVDDAARQATARFPEEGLDLVVLPEFALMRETGTTAREQAVTLSGEVLDVMSERARRYRTWLVVPLVLREEGESERISNAAALFDRDGAVAGIFRKVNPMLDAQNLLEGGVTPGSSYPVFECDFGRLGILICWDMTDEEGWSALASAGAELVVVPSASPQTLRPMAHALQHGYYVMTSTPRNNASLFDPIGQTKTQITAPGVLVDRIDLSYAILHWTERLQGGRILTENYGERVGYSYSDREDTGVFWSNDPQTPIGSMIRKLGLPEMSESIERVRAARDRAR
jgi:predicted amidohydrolase